MHVAVTGASSGIGEAIAREFANAGAKLTLVARRKERLEALAIELGCPSFVAAVDLSDPAHAADWIAKAEQALGPIDVLVSNAGSLTLGPVATFDPELGERMMKLNFLTPARLIRAVLPGMLQRKNGVIVNVTSLAALVPIPDWIYQAASKTASAVFSETLRIETKGSGVHVMTVYPGMTDTPMAQGGLDAYGRSGIAAMIPLGDAKILARRLRRAVERRKSRVIYPGFYALARWFPRIAGWLSARLAPRIGDGKTPKALSMRAPLNSEKESTS
jgi:short-subunit dehydrogenase